MTSYSYEMYSEKINELKFETVTKEDIELLVDSLEGELECDNINKAEYNLLLGKLIIKVLLNK